MALADWFSTRSPLRLEGGGVILRPYRSGDYAEWAEVRLASRDFLQPWEPVWPAGPVGSTSSTARGSTR